MRLVFFPAFQDSAALTDHFYRLHWYLYPFRDEIEAIVLPVANPDIKVGAPADFLDQTLPDLVGKIHVEVRVVAGEEDLANELRSADAVFCWAVGEDGKVPSHNALSGKRVLRIDHTKLQHASSFYLKFPETFEPLQKSYIDRSVKIFEKIRERCKSRIGYIFGTGPGLSLASQHDFSDGVSIACNSMVRNYELLERLKPPLIVVADPIFHAGPSSYAAAFRADLVRAMGKYGSYLFVPLRDYHIYISHLPEKFRDRIAALPFKSGEVPNLDISESYHVTSTGNILTLFLLPLGATFFKEVRIFGCDGRPLHENNYFWGHDKASQFNDKMADIIKAHPAFFAIDFDNYYLTHCNIVERWLCEMERRGVTATNHTPSYIPALRDRSAGPLVAGAAAIPEVISAPKPLFVSIDPEVGKNFGHFTPLNDRASEAAAIAGMEFVTFGNIDTTALDASRGYLKPHFSENSWSFRARDLGVNGDSYRKFLADLKRARTELVALGPRPQTHIFMYCGSMSAAEALLDVFDGDENVLLAVNLFWCSFFDYTEPWFSERWRGLAARFTRSGRHRFFGTTDKLADGLSRVLGLPVRALPHVSPTYSDAESWDLLEQTPRRLAAACRPSISFPAVSKAEKGAAERIEIIRAIKQDPELSSCRVLVRGDVHEFAEFGDDVTVYPNHLSDEAYRRVVSEGDIGVLLYKQETFSDRPSGLFLDLLMNHVPVVTTSGSWIGDFVAGCGGGVVMPSTDPSLIITGIKKVIANYDTYTGAAREAGLQWYASNTWLEFVKEIALPPKALSEQGVQKPVATSQPPHSATPSPPMPVISPGALNRPSAPQVAASALAVAPKAAGASIDAAPLAQRAAANGAHPPLTIFPVRAGGSAAAPAPASPKADKPAPAVNAPPPPAKPAPPQTDPASAAAAAQTRAALRAAARASSAPPPLDPKLSGGFVQRAVAHVKRSRVARLAIALGALTIAAAVAFLASPVLPEAKAIIFALAGMLVLALGLAYLGYRSFNAAARLFAQTQALQMRLNDTNREVGDLWSELADGVGMESRNIGARLPGIDQRLAALQLIVEDFMGAVRAREAAKTRDLEMRLDEIVRRVSLSTTQSENDRKAHTGMVEALRGELASSKEASNLALAQAASALDQREASLKADLLRHVSNLSGEISAASGAMGQSLQQSRSEQGALASRLQDVTDRVTALGANLDAIVPRVAGFEPRIERLGRDMAQAENDRTENAHQIAELSAGSSRRFEELTSLLAGADGVARRLGDRIEAVRDALEQTQAQGEAQGRQLAQISADVSGLTGRASHNETEFAASRDALQAQIDEARQALADLRGAQAGVEESIAALELSTRSRADALVQQDEEQTRSIVSLGEALRAAEEKSGANLAEQGSRIDALATAQSSLEANGEALKAEQIRTEQITVRLHGLIEANMKKLEEVRAQTEALRAAEEKSGANLAEQGSRIDALATAQSSLEANGEALKAEQIRTEQITVRLHGLIEANMEKLEEARAQTDVLIEGLQTSENNLAATRDAVGKLAADLQTKAGDISQQLASVSGLASETAMRADATEKTLAVQQKAMTDIAGIGAKVQRFQYELLMAETANAANTANLWGEVGKLARTTGVEIQREHIGVQRFPDVFPDVASDVMKPLYTINGRLSFAPGRAELGARVLVNSVPKSGTYLHSRLLQELGVANLNVHLSSSFAQDFRGDSLQDVIENSSRFSMPLGFSRTASLVAEGQFAVAHIDYSVEAAAILKDFVHLFAVRDLRNVLVSFMRFSIDPRRQDRLKAPIFQELQGPELFHKFLAGPGQTYLKKRIVPILGWLGKPDVVMVRFEDITGEAGEQVQAETLKVICEKIGIEAPEDPVAFLRNNVLNKETRTYSGHLSKFGEYWSDEVDALFDEIGGHGLNAILGYPRPEPSQG